MAFTFRTITHTWTDPDQTNANGLLRFHLPVQMTNGTQTIVPGDVDATWLNGVASVTVAANDDAATVPTDVQWQVTLDLPGQPPVTYSVTVPSAGSGAIDLATLLPSAPQVG